MNPRQPAFATAATISARPTHIMPPCTMGMRTPSFVLSHVLKGIGMVGRNPEDTTWVGNWLLLALSQTHGAPSTVRVLDDSSEERESRHESRHLVGREGGLAGLLIGQTLRPRQTRFHLHQTTERVPFRPRSLQTSTKVGKRLRYLPKVLLHDLS